MFSGQFPKTGIDTPPNNTQECFVQHMLRKHHTCTCSATHHTKAYSTNGDDSRCVCAFTQLATMPPSPIAALVLGAVTAAVAAKDKPSNFVIMLAVRHRTHARVHAHSLSGYRLRSCTVCACHRGVRGVVSQA